MTKALSLALLLIAMTSANALADCDNAMTQTEMNICARQDYEEADKELNLAYGEAMAILTGAHGDALKKSQRAWITYRDLACESYGLMAEGGSMQPMLVNNCLAQITRDRTRIIAEQGSTN